VPSSWILFFSYQDYALSSTHQILKKGFGPLGVLVFSALEVAYKTQNA